MSGSSQNPQDVLKEIQSNAENLLAKLRQWPMPEILQIAMNQLPISNTEKIYAQAGQYIGRWLLAPQRVHDVADKWMTAQESAKVAVNDFTTHLAEIGRYWTGPAAGAFMDYANPGVLSSLNSVPDAAETMGEGVAQLASDLAYLRDEIVGDGFKIASGLLDTVAQIAKAMTNAVDLQKLVEGLSGAGLALATTQWCCAVAATISDKVNTLFGNLIDLGKKVDEALARMSQNAETVRGKVQKTLKDPPEAPPIDGGDAKHWHPVAC